MAAAIRSMVGKVGNRRSVTNTVTPFEIRTLNINHNQDVFPVSMPHLNLGYSSRHPLEFLSVLLRPCIQRLPGKKIEPEHQIIPEILFLGASPIANSSRYCPRVVINAHFALEEFNKQKNAQLQFVKVVKAYHQSRGGCVLNHHLLTLETIYADNVIQIYQAIVKEYSTGNPPVQLLLFGLVADNGNGSLLKLIDNRCAGRLGPTDNRSCFEEVSFSEQVNLIEPGSLEKTKMHMAAAIRSMLGKVGNRRSVANTVPPFEIKTLSINHNQDVFPVSMPRLNLGYSSRHPLEFLSVLHRPCIQRLPAKKIEPEHQIIPEILFLGASPIANSSRYCPRVVINAHFALEEFNKQKNAQLQFVRVVKAYNQLSGGGGLKHRLLTLETIDADNVIQIYQAIVKEYSNGKPPVQLLLFGLVADNGNGSLLKLIDNRCAGRRGPTDNRRVGQKIIKVQKTKRYSLEEEILSTLHILLLK